MAIKEIKDFHETPFERIESRMNSCMKSGDKHENGYGKVGVVPFCCGVLFCPTCLPHRLSDVHDKFGWMKDESKYGFKIVSSKEIKSSLDVVNGFDMLLQWRGNLSALSWYRVALTSKHIIAVYKRDDKDAIEALKAFPDFSAPAFLSEYVDYTGIVDLDAQETLVINYKGKRRMLGRGRTPPKHIKRCELSVEDAASKKLWALKRKSTIVSKEEMEKLPEAVKRPIQNLTYAVAEDVNLNYIQLLQAYITGNYKEEYEEYLGAFDSNLNKKWLRHLFKISSDYKFLEEYIKKQDAYDIMRKEERRNK